MYSGYTNQQMSLGFNQETATWNAINQHWAAIKNIQKIKAELDLNQQINALAHQLSFLPIKAIANRPPFTFEINQTWFPKGLIDMATRIGRAIGWDSTAVLIAKLSGVAMAASGVYQISVRPGWTEELLLYVMVIAESGAGKSRLINIIKKPMLAVMDEKISRYDQTAGRQTFISKEQVKAIRRACSGGVKTKIQAESSREGRYDYNKIMQVTAEEAAMAHDAIEQAEKARPDSRPCLFLSSGTSKGIQAALIQNHEYQAICEPEGGLILKMSQETGFDLDLLLKSYDGEGHQYVVQHGVARLKRPRLNILYGVQPGVAAKLYGCGTLNERGLTARFVPVFPILQERQNIEGATLDDDDFIIRHILEICHDLNRDGLIRVIRLDREAEQVIAAFERELENLIPAGFDHLAAFIHKLRGTACRLAAALHLWVNCQHPEEIPISAQTMACGIELARTLLPQADYVHNPHGLKAHASAMRLLEWIKKYPRSHFELRSALQDTGLKKPQALPALDVLEMHNIIKQIVTSTNSITCVVNPNLYGPAPNNIAVPQLQHIPTYPVNEPGGYCSRDDRNGLF